MTVRDVMVRAIGLTKVYRLYRRPSYRFRDMFGLLGDVPGAFTEHTALDAVDLEITRGQKVAIIGRNGAGKSTFLKLVTGVVQPTSGSLQVKGTIHALLQIGTGFHPDFTGRENVYAYFAQLGVSGVEADRRFRDVVDFAEIEEYIDQPVKTYSTGMAVRLMFSTSTAITPDLLVLDEVLGVGDAYFAHKSFHRMKELCEQAGSTLLLVTHDVYSAVNLCERLIWLDRGRVLIDGDGPTVVKAYEDSIRQQEESRLRVRTQQKLALAAQQATRSSAGGHLLVEIHSRGNRPQPCPVYFSAIDLVAGGRTVSSVPLTSVSFDTTDRAHLEREASCWGDPVQWEGREARPFLNYGSPFHKVAGVFVVPPDVPATDLAVRLEYWTAEPCDLLVRAFADGRGVSLGALPPVSKAWTTHTTALADADQTSTVFSSDGVQGTGAIVIDAVRMVDERGSETCVAHHGAPVRFLLDYRIADPTIHERAQVVLIFHRDGIQIASRIITRELVFDATCCSRGRVRLEIPKLALADGAYSVSVFVAREGYFDERQTVFYALNSGVYYCLNRVLDVVVIGGGLIAAGAVFVDHGEWTLEPAPNGAGL
jgi:ABC-type polysaccharide/polyol phosphate transport system ATPase subunit